MGGNSRNFNTVQPKLFAAIDFILSRRPFFSWPSELIKTTVAIEYFEELTYENLDVFKELKLQVFIKEMISKIRFLLPNAFSDLGIVPNSAQ